MNGDAPVSTQPWPKDTRANIKITMTGCLGQTCTSLVFSSRRFTFFTDEFKLLYGYIKYTTQASGWQTHDSWSSSISYTELLEHFTPRAWVAAKARKARALLCNLPACCHLQFRTQN